MKPTRKKPEYLFVYGSLRRNAKNSVLDEVRPHLNYMGAASFPGILFDLGEYPGAILSDDNSVKIKGELYAISDHRNDVFRTLDEYEEYFRDNISKSLFIRKRVDVNLYGGKKVNSWVYLFNEKLLLKKPAKKIPSGDYLRFIKSKNHA
ncbi:MAG: gamma-glutamylcyclotransferase family protein [Bacteroidia bacterium]